MLEAALDMVEHVRDEPVWRPVPDEVRAALRTPLPREGAGEAAAFEAMLKDVLPYRTGNIHPRFFGWVHGAGLPVGIVAEMVAAAMNSNVGGRQHGAVYRRAPGDRLVPRAVRLPGGRQRAGHHRHLDGDPDRAGGRAPPGERGSGRRPGHCRQPHRIWSATPRARPTAASPGPSRCWAWARTGCAGSRSTRRSGSTSRRSTRRSPPIGRRACDRSASSATAGTVNIGAIDDLAGACRDRGAGRPVAPRRRRVRRARHAERGAAPATGRHRAGGFARLRFPQVGPRALRRRLRAGARRTDATAPPSPSGRPISPPAATGWPAASHGSAISGPSSRAASAR